MISFCSFNLRFVLLYLATLIFLLIFSKYGWCFTYDTFSCLSSFRRSMSYLTKGGKPISLLDSSR